MSKKKSTKSTKNLMYMRYGQRCMLCGWKPRGHAQKHNVHSNYLTYHHIRERHENGPTNVENGAILCKECHAWLHQQPKLVKLELNEYLKNYKKRMDNQRK